MQSTEKNKLMLKRGAKKIKIKSKMQLKLMFKRRNKEITLVILLLIIFLSTVIIEARGDDNAVVSSAKVDGNQTNVGKHKRVKRFLSMRPGQRFLVSENLIQSHFVFLNVQILFA